MVCSVSAGGVAQPKVNLRLPIGLLDRSEGRAICARSKCLPSNFESKYAKRAFSFPEGIEKARLKQTTLALNPRRGLRDQPACCRLRPRSERGQGRLLDPRFHRLFVKGPTTSGYVGDSFAEAVMSGAAAFPEHDRAARRELGDRSAAFSCGCGCGRGR